MKGLILDTSGETSLLAISDQGVLVHSLFLTSARSSSELAQHIQIFMEQSGMNLSHLNYIGIGIGPGSFLGTRIGATLAKSLAYGLQIPLVSFCSLQAYQPSCSSQFSVITDAKSKGIYLLKGQKNSDMVVYDATPQLYSIEEFSISQEEHPLCITPHKNIVLQKMPFLQKKLLESSPSLPYLCEYCYEQISLSQIEALDTMPIHYLRLS